MRLLFSLILLLNFFFCSAQIRLKPFIGLHKCPSDKDTVSQSLNLNFNGKELGPITGSPINYFKLYGLNNDSLDIVTELKKGKYVLLINASYTCPIFRKTIYFFDSISGSNKNISCFIIYTIEGHPGSPYICPYTNAPWEAKANIKEGIDIKQPVNYGERKQAARTMVKKTGTKIPVFIDGPGNEWINTFGAMPALAYIIDPNGKVKFKYRNYKGQKKEICRDLNLMTEKTP